MARQAAEIERDLFNGARSPGRRTGKESSAPSGADDPALLCGRRSRCLSCRSDQARLGKPVGFLSGLISGGTRRSSSSSSCRGFILAYVHAGESERAACNVKAPGSGGCALPASRRPTTWRSLLALPIVTQVVAQSPASGWSIAVGLASVMLFLQAWWPAYIDALELPRVVVVGGVSVLRALSLAGAHWARWPATIVLAASYALIVLTSV